MPTTIDGKVTPLTTQNTTGIARIKQALSSWWPSPWPIGDFIAELRGKPYANEAATAVAYPIFANGNCPGQALVERDPELVAIYHETAPAAADYPQPKTDGYCEAIARFTGAPPEAVIPMGSGLKQIGALVRHLHPTEVIALDGDFRGYALASEVQGIPFRSVPAEPGLDDRIYDVLADQAAQCWRPIFMTTIGFTNPLATCIDPHRAVAAIKAANPDAMVIVDSAYAEYAGISQAELTPLALNYAGVIVLAPASKILFAAGAASGWLIVGDKALLRHLGTKAWPYEPSGFGSRLLPKLIGRADLINRARSQVQHASAILGAGCSELFGAAKVSAGPWPWVLVDAGHAAGDVTNSLKAKEIHVQRQSGISGQLGQNWIRISSTTPAQAQAIVDALRDLLRGGSVN
ncbi:aminotransferase class I/II-fold pyridoxal phosphate-dependent enzyme [Novosphingobium sp.]|uniref:aminotransferase class I/II-fold pyridoxal phosphate-dependent enzyme n=1 Tax=Novosphingobium sp. TaxID=1874826 RepID=UPI0025F7B8F7|nr:aminotransferase class I/II-fold pyridoxal phosphate-dependent enzyme [Novosphingobium sp.]MCC6927290.1 hypothetical protein [Novosphingobium sp.]